MKGVLLDSDTMGPDIDLGPITATLDEWAIYPLTAPDEIATRIQDADIVLSNKALIGAEQMQRAPQLKLISVLATGTNNIDLDAARQQGIRVCNAVKYGTATVVQHALNLMLTLATRLPDYQRAVQHGDWQRSPFFCLLDYPIMELADKLLVIVGYGELGQGLARVADALGMRVAVAQRPGVQTHGQTADGRPRLPLAELLPQADVISLHCPLTPDTHHLIDRAALAALKPSALLINTARGGLVDEAALAEALRQGQLGGAGIDVLSEEPPRQGNPLLAADIPNLIVTPHCAWGSREARQRIVEITANNIKAFLAGAPVNIVV